MAKTNGKKFAFVMGRITPSKERDVVQRMYQLDSVDDVKLTMGKFDFIAKIHFSDFESFFESYLEIKHIQDLRPEKILIASNGGSA